MYISFILEILALNFPFLFAIRLNHMKLLFWQVKKQSDSGNFMWFIKQETGSTRDGLTKSNSLLQALW